MKKVQLRYSVPRCGIKYSIESTAQVGSYGLATRTLSLLVIYLPRLGRYIVDLIFTREPLNSTQDLMYFVGTNGP